MELTGLGVVCSCALNTVLSTRITVGEDSIVLKHSCIESRLEQFSEHLLAMCVCVFTGGLWSRMYKIGAYSTFSEAYGLEFTVFDICIHIYIYMYIYIYTHVWLRLGIWVPLRLHRA